MRMTLLVVFGGLIFLVALFPLQASLGLDSPQMRWMLFPLLGGDIEGRVVPGGTPKDLLAYGVAFAIAGFCGRWFRRLLYQRRCRSVYV